MGRPESGQHRNRIHWTWPGASARTHPIRRRPIQGPEWHTGTKVIFLHNLIIQQETRYSTIDLTASYHTVNSTNTPTATASSSSPMRPPGSGDSTCPSGSKTRPWPWRITMFGQPRGVVIPRGSKGPSRRWPALSRRRRRGRISPPRSSLASCKRCNW